MLSRVCPLAGGSLSGRFVIRGMWLVVMVVVAIPILAGFPGRAGAMEVDLGGRTVTIAGFAHEITPFAARGEQTFEDPEGRLLAHIEEIQQQFHVELEFIHHPSHAAVMDDIRSEVLAGEPEVEVYMIRRREMIELAADGFLYPFDAFISDYYDRVPRMFQNQEHGRFMGSDYMINTLQLPPTPIGVLWNRDLFVEEGLPDLYELYEAGEWTWERLLEIAVAATRDTTGDGELDRWGIDLTESAQDKPVVPELAMTNNAAMTRTVDGRVEMATSEQEFLEVLDFMHALFSDQELPTWWGGGLFRDGNMAMEFNAMRSINWPSYEGVDFPVGIVPMPIGPERDDYVYPEWSIWGYGMPATVEDPAGIFELLKALYLLTDEYTDVEQWEEEYWEDYVALFVHDRESLEIMRHAVYNSQIACPYWDVIDSSELWAAIEAAVEGERSPAAALSEIEPILQAVLDEVLVQ